jgi:hypothetical protein
MNKLFDNDIREIMQELDNKRRKENEGKGGDPEYQEVYTQSDPNSRLSPTKQNPDQNKELMNIEDLDEITSIDSDTREEEKKFSSLGGVLGGKKLYNNLFYIGGQDANNSTVSDVLEHAK